MQVFDRRFQALYAFHVNALCTGAEMESSILHFINNFLPVSSGE